MKIGKVIISKQLLENIEFSDFIFDIIDTILITNYDKERVEVLCICEHFINNSVDKNIPNYNFFIEERFNNDFKLKQIYRYDN